MSYSHPSRRRQSSRRRGSSPRHGGARRNSSRRKKKGQPSFDPRQFINTNPVEEKVEEYIPKHTFADFGLDIRIVNALTSRGFVNPTPIQDQSIPTGLAGGDLIGLAETGTGKTAAFLLPLIHHTLKNPRRTTVVLAPTRELAIQINNELKSFTRNLRLYSAICVGGTPIRPQIQALRKHNHFVIGTPGRMLDLLKKRHFKTQTVQSVVLDEADRMLDMGFITDIKAILAWMPPARQTLLFSATMNNATKQIVDAFLKNPVTVSVKKRDATASVEQNVVEHTQDAKYPTLLELLQHPDYERVIVFGAMKRSVEELARKMRQDGIEAASLHGDKNHRERQRALKSFKEGRAKVMVATDVAARGIHVDDVSHVINYDLPNTFEDYIHRIGRTGRGDKRGKALTFVTATRRERQTSK